MFAKSLHHASSIRLKAAHPHYVSVEFRTYVQCYLMFNPYCILWFHCETINGCEYANMKYILMFLISCLWICLSLLRKIKAYYDGKEHHTVLPLFRMYEIMWCSVQLFRGIRRCRFNDQLNDMYELTVLWCWSFTTQWQAHSCSECISSSVSKSSILSPGGYQYFNITEE